MQMTWEVAVPAGAELAERPVWDTAAQQLLWVSILAGELHGYADQADDVVLARAGVPVGAAAPRSSGGYVLAAADGFRLTRSDGSPDAAPLRPGGLPGGVRFNDGACDPAGRFWAGTAALDGSPGRGSLYRLDPDLAITEVLTGVSESNGLGWSPDAATFYYIDSGEAEPRVRAFCFMIETGELHDERDLIRFGPDDGVPDGLAVDEGGCLWIAMWDGASVRRYSPSGELLAVYAVPVSRPTCPGFGGPELDILYLSTAWEGLDDRRRAAEPLAGHLLRTRPGIRGLPAASYGG